MTNRFPARRHESRCISRLLGAIGRWRLAGVALAPADFRGRFESGDLGSISLQRLSLDGPALLVGAPRAHSAGIMFVDADDGDVIVDSTPIDRQTFWHGAGRARFVLRSRNRMEVVLVNWRGNGASVSPTSFLPAPIRLAGRDPSAGLLLKKSGIGNHVASIRRAIRMTQDPQRAWRNQESLRFVDEVAGAIGGALSDARVCTPPGRVRRRRLSAFLRSFDYLRRVPDLRHTQPDRLSGAARVHPRTLQSIYRELVGVTPKRFARLVQLQRIREFLESTGEHAGPMADIARLASFSSASHFSASYKALFGESPLQTASG